MGSFSDGELTPGRSSSRGKRLACVGGLTAILVLVGAGHPWVDRAAKASETYTGMSAADGTRVSVALEEFLLVDSEVVGAPRAQAMVSSLEGSRAFAAFTDPGETFRVLGISSIEGASQVDVPTPLWARSSYPGQQEARTGIGPVTVEALSSDGSSEATASAPLGNDDVRLSDLRASAGVARESGSGTLNAVASSTARGVSVGEVLRIGSIESRAEVTRVPGEEARTESRFGVTGVSIAGEDVTLDLGDARPLPEDRPLAEALEEAGIVVEVVPREEADGGVVSAGLRIRVTHEIPNAPKPAVVTFEFGRVMAYTDMDAESSGQDALSDFGAAGGSSQTRQSGERAGSDTLGGGLSSRPILNWGGPATSSGSSGFGGSGMLESEEEVAGVRGPLLVAPMSWMSLFLSGGLAVTILLLLTYLFRGYGVKREWIS